MDLFVPMLAATAHFRDVVTPCTSDKLATGDATGEQFDSAAVELAGDSSSSETLISPSSSSSSSSVSPYSSRGSVDDDDVMQLLPTLYDAGLNSRWMTTLSDVGDGLASGDDDLLAVAERGNGSSGHFSDLDEVASGHDGLLTADVDAADADCGMVVLGVGLRHLMNHVDDPTPCPAASLNLGSVVGLRRPSESALTFASGDELTSTRRPAAADSRCLSHLLRSGSADRRRVVDDVLSDQNNNSIVAIQPDDFRSRAVPRDSAARHVDRRDRFDDVANGPSVRSRLTSGSASAEQVDRTLVEPRCSSLPTARASAAVISCLVPSTPLSRPRLLHTGSGNPPSPTSTSLSDERQHCCTYPTCARSYSKSSHLKAHLRRHTGENRAENMSLQLSITSCF